MKRFLLALAFAAFAPFCHAQGSPSSGINASLLKFFGNTKAFTAKGDVRVTDDAGKEVSTIPVNWALLNGTLRADMDLSQLKATMASPESSAMIKQMGMDKLQLLMSSASNTTLMIYPGLQAYAPASDKSLTGEEKVETTDLGKEPLDGHPCVKKKLTTTDAKGRVHEALVWTATDLKDFPIQMQTKEKKNTITIKFSAPSLEKPDAKLFEIPANYTRYDSVQALMQAAMMKMFGGAK